MGKDYFSHDIDAKNNIKVAKMMLDYGYAGLGYYWTIVEKIYDCDGEFDMKDISVLAKYMELDENLLTTFINKCVNDYTEKGVGLFTLNDDLLSSNSIRRRIELRNKRSAARTQSEVTERKEIDGIEYVNLTEEHYEKLIDKYGDELTLKAISLLDTWLSKKGKSAKQYIGKNHYAHFRSDSWVIQNAKESLGMNKKPNWSI